MGLRDAWRKASEEAEAAARAKKDAELAAYRAQRTAEFRGESVGDPSKKKISEVGDKTTGILACPKCGGTQFTAKRSAKGKTIGVVTLGVGAVLAPKSRVRCVTCKTEYLRG